MDLKVLHTGFHFPRRVPDMINTRDAQFKPILFLLLGSTSYQKLCRLFFYRSATEFQDRKIKKNHISDSQGRNATLQYYCNSKQRVTVFAWLLAALTVRQGTNNKWNNELVKTTWKRCVKTIWKCRAAVEVKEICALAAIECAAP
ncbi:hypothetical protein BT96DRAFT_945962 [Gymnopus androsaceus JB14]|uniref:Uncharacterized protein n=1 Tax=Gymnopus androsaceus JB14 TaxID=1447944 RepID=A0A6A4GXM5_9AGAR|nr:hypothetical protein BT96DRAFT_945962 [Gymnopus androsaceus JB14]